MAHWTKANTVQAKRALEHFYHWKRQQRRLFCGSPACNRRLGMRIARRRWNQGEARCLDALWGLRESRWSQYAHNSSSGAHGIPQALPGSKMGAGWWDNVLTQIRWGIAYIAGRYGTPCGALSHSHSTGWY